jgi:predicted HTH domain antitoxin
MPLVIPDDVLARAGLTETEVLIEIACRFLAADRLGFHAAARLCGLERVGFEEELLKRGIAVYRPTVDDLERDLEALRRLGS